MLRWIVLVAIIACCLGSCGDSGGDGRGPVEVLEGEEAVQASAEAAVGLASAIVAILGDAGTSSTGLNAMVGEGSTAGVSRRAIRVACPQGGSVDGECREEGGRTIVSSLSDGCAVFDLGILATASGRLRATYERAGLCGSSTIPDDIPFTFVFEDFREEQRRDGELVRLFQASRLSESFRPRPGGCSPNDGTLSLQGDARITRATTDLLLRMEGLDLDVASDGNPCAEEVVASGRLDVEDNRRGSRFAGDLRGFRFISTRALDAFVEVDLDGTAEIDCLGSVRFATQTPLALGGSCPADGEVGVSLAGADVASVVFSGGVAIDFDGDGSSDFESAGCGAESLAVCR